MDGRILFGIRTPGMKFPLRILHLEDNSADAELIQHTLMAGGILGEVTRVQTQEEFRSALRHLKPELVLADYALPGFDGLLALEIVREVSADIPFILVSGTVGEERAIESLKSGATDYVLKNRLARLVPAVRRALQESELQLARRQAAAAQEESNRKLQALSRRLVETQESERRHIARELHDEIGQTLTLAQLNLQGALAQSESAAQRQRLQEGLTAVDRVLTQIHDISLNLRPSLLDDLGLAPALRWYTQRQAAVAGVETEFLAPDHMQRFPAQIETECFRIAQEALTNAMRHAQAKKIQVELQVIENQLHLCIKDDGLGFEVQSRRARAVRGASMGLLSMEERAALAGGQLEIISASGQGTAIRAWLPLAECENNFTATPHE